MPQVVGLCVPAISPAAALPPQLAYHATRLGELARKAARLAGSSTADGAWLHRSGSAQPSLLNPVGGVQSVTKRMLRVREEIMGPGKYESVGKSQSVLSLIDPIISPRTPYCTASVARRCTSSAGCTPVPLTCVRRGVSVFRQAALSVDTVGALSIHRPVSAAGKASLSQAWGSPPAPRPQRAPVTNQPSR
jgi:hypothetical protein